MQECFVLFFLIVEFLTDAVVTNVIILLEIWPRGLICRRKASISLWLGWH
ncbi:hypothetical protein ACFOG5_00470 [Pedobacter fastidiosus]